MSGFGRHGVILDGKKVRNELLGEYKKIRPKLNSFNEFIEKEQNQ